MAEGENRCGKGCLRPGVRAREAGCAAMKAKAGTLKHGLNEGSTVREPKTEKLKPPLP